MNDEIKKPIVTIFEFSHWGGKFLYNADCLAESMGNALNYCKGSDYLQNDPETILLLEETKGYLLPQNKLEEIFQDDITIDFEFAKQLHQYDILDNVFVSSTKRGQALINLLLGDVRFIIQAREWTSPTHLQLSLEVCGEDYVYEVISELVKGNAI